MFLFMKYLLPIISLSNFLNQKKQSKTGSKIRGAATQSWPWLLGSHFILLVRLSSFINMLVQMCASFSNQSIKSLLLFLPPLVFSFLSSKSSYGHIFVLSSMRKHLLKEARSKEFRRQEEELRLDTLVAENSTHLHQYIEN